MTVMIVADVMLTGKNAQTTHLLEVFENVGRDEPTLLVVPRPIEVKVDRPGIVYLSHPRLQLLFQFVLLARAWSLIRRHNVDLIYVRQGGWLFTPMLIAKIFGVRLAVEINGILLEEMAKRPAWQLRIVRWCERLSYRHATRIVAVTPAIGEWIEKQYAPALGKVVVIENGANTDLFAPREQADCRRELKWHPDARYVLFVGHLAHWQGVEHVVRAMPSVIARVPDAHLVVVGEGPERSSLTKLAEELGVGDHVAFLGSVPYSRVPTYIGGADICVAPKVPLASGYSPLKLYEYMASGRPVVASRVRGFEVLERAEAGVLVTPNDAGAFAAALVELLGDPTRRTRMGENGRVEVVENHSWRAVAKRVLASCR